MMVMSQPGVRPQHVETVDNLFHTSFHFQKHHLIQISPENDDYRYLIKYDHIRILTY